MSKSIIWSQNCHMIVFACSISDFFDYLLWFCSWLDVVNLLLLCGLSAESCRRNGCSRGLSRGSCVNLELCKVGEHLAHSCPCQREILNQISLEKLRTLSECARKTQVDLASLVCSVNSNDLKSTFNCSCLRLLALLTFSVNKKCSWNLLLNDGEDIRILVVELLTCLSNSDRIAMAVLILQVVWWTTDNEASIDHDCDLVTKLLSFVHPMRRQQNWSLLHLLNHAVEWAAGDRVYAACWLVKEENFRAVHEGLCATQFALVSTAKILWESILERCQVKVLRDDSLEDIASQSTDSSQTGNKVETLINCHFIPNQIFLVADTKEFAIFAQVKSAERLTHKLWLSWGDGELHSHHTKGGWLTGSIWPQ